MAVNQKSNQFLILGGGLMGLSIAHALASKGLQVEVISRRRMEAAGFVAAGMLAPHAEGLQGNLLKLGQLSLDRIPKWIAKIEKDSGISCGLRMNGIIVPFKNKIEREKYPTILFGEKLNRDELEKEIPGISSEWNAGLLFKQDGQIDNRRLLMRALEKACVELGVLFQEGAEVLDIIKHSNKFNGVQIRNAEGELEQIICDQAVLCSGAWSNQLLKELPVFPVKGQMLSIQGPKEAIKRIIFGPGTYLVPREDGLIIVGATSEQKEGFKEGSTPWGQKELRKGIYSLIPSAQRWPHMEHWWGFRPCTPDQSPILGKSSLHGLWLATGHHRNGVLLAAITSELITKSIRNELNNTQDEDLLKNFYWDRFKQTSSYGSTLQT